MTMIRRLSAGPVLGGLVLVLAPPLAALAQDADGAHYVSAAALRASVAKTTGGLATYTVPTGEGAPVLMVRREADGEVEIHERLNDEFVAHSGRARVMVGGKAEGQRQTAPGEWRGGTLTGGKVYDLQPGDVLWIPAGVPHQALVATSFEYLAFKFPVAAK